MEEEIIEEPKETYHYIIGVGTNSIQHPRPGSFYRDITLKYSDEEYDKFMRAVEDSKNPLWKTTLSEGCNIFEIENFAAMMKGIQIRMAVHPLMLIHFTTPFEMDDKELDVFIEYSDIKTLQKYKVKSGGLSER